MTNTSSILLLVDFIEKLFFASLISSSIRTYYNSNVPIIGLEMLEIAFQLVVDVRT